MTKGSVRRKRNLEWGSLGWESRDEVWPWLQWLLARARGAGGLPCCSLGLAALGLSGASGTHDPGVWGGDSSVEIPVLRSRFTCGLGRAVAGHRWSMAGGDMPSSASPAPALSLGWMSVTVVCSRPAFFVPAVFFWVHQRPACCSSITFFFFFFLSLFTCSLLVV